MNREVLLDKSDVREVRPKCDICGYELTFIEYYLLQARCVFHAGNLTSVMKMSKWQLIKIFFRDIDITRKKIWMRINGLDAIDYMACVGTVKPNLRDIVEDKDMEKLLRAMDKHTGVVA